MYMDQMISVGKAANGFIVECHVKFKTDAKMTEKMNKCGCSPSDCAGSCEKQYIAEDAEEVGELIANIMPLLDGDYTNESEFDSAFDEATKNIESAQEETGETTDMKGAK